MNFEPAPLLAAAAERLGVDLGYWDIWGRRHQTSEAALRAILGAMGVDVSDPKALERTAQAGAVKDGRRLLEPVQVISWTEAAPKVELRLPPGTVPAGPLSLALYWEDGWSECRDLRLEDLERDPAATACRVPLPAPLRLGYHDIEVVVQPKGGAEVRGATRLIVVPEKAWQPERLRSGGRLAGLAVSLYGLRSERNWGVGDFADLGRLAEWAVREMGVGFLALNPLHALHNRQPYNTSPYLPLSSFYRNFLYLDVESLEDYQASPAARRLVGGERFQSECAALRQSEYVEYERVARLKKAVLRLAFRRFLREEWTPDTARAKAFRRWSAAEGGLLERFAIYSTLDEVLHRRDRNLWIWPDWPAEYRDPDSAAVRALAARHWRSVLFHKWLQWQIDAQLKAAQAKAELLGMPVGLYHDLALATDRCGSDLWAHRQGFVQGCRVGAPPDEFAPEGQDWSFPPPDWEAQREDGYRLYIETIRKNGRHGGALRIDHFMRFFRLFWIPEGMTAMEGTYVNERWQELMGILALESVRGRFLVVGEDLGTVPPGLRDAMEQFGMFGYRLFYFERDAEGRPVAPEAYPRHVLVSSTTHDLPTLAGFWAGRDIEARRAAGILRDDAQYERQKRERREDKARMIDALKRAGLLAAEFPSEAADWPELTGELHYAVIGYLVSTPSQLMLLNQEDLTKEPDQQNLPGTTWEYPNWRRKSRFSLEEFETLPLAGDFARMFRGWLERAGRLSG
jgi:4-alpha-glucanotransferase